MLSERLLTSSTFFLPVERGTLHSITIATLTPPSGVGLVFVAATELQQHQFLPRRPHVNSTMLSEGISHCASTGWFEMRVYLWVKHLNPVAVQRGL